VRLYLISRPANPYLFRGQRINFPITAIAPLRALDGVSIMIDWVAL
jgi:hypothetical protein